MLTQDRLKYLLRYEPDTGVFRWNVKQGTRCKDEIAGSLTNKGYISIKIDCVWYAAHRLVFLYENGEFPELEVDHKDGNRRSNKRDNLRLVTLAQNAQNAKLRKDSTTGIKGVSFHKPTGKYQVRIAADGKKIYVGLFDDIKDAEIAAIQAREAYHEEYARYD